VAVAGDIVLDNSTWLAAGALKLDAALGTPSPAGSTITATSPSSEGTCEHCS